MNLFNDIKKLRDSNDPERTHFLATIVLMNTSEREEVGPDEFVIYDIVDGQQTPHYIGYFTKGDYETTANW